MTDYSQRLFDLLAPNSGGVVVIFEGYFDESGDLEAAPNIFCVSGYFLESGRAKHMDIEWSRVLARYNVPYFHMVDCAHGNGVFSDVPEIDRSQLVRDLITLIKDHTLEGFSALCRGDLFVASDRYPNAYSGGATMCVSALQSFLQTNRIAGDMAYFFEAGHKHKGSAYNLIADKLGTSGGSVTFADKKHLRLLQAADLLAWQSTKYAKDALTQARSPRKDFLSLVEHPHMFIYLAMNEKGEDEHNIVLWPETRRAQSTTSFKMNYEGPIRFMYENDGTVPIIPVGATLGWRNSTGGNFVLIDFQPLGPPGKDFSIAFDQLRLFEVIGCFLSATGAYPKNNLQVVLTPDELAITNTSNGIVLSATMPEGAKVGLSMSRDTATELMRHLKNALDKVSPSSEVES